MNSPKKGGGGGCDSRARRLAIRKGKETLHCCQTKTISIADQRKIMEKVDKIQNKMNSRRRKKKKLNAVINNGTNYAPIII